jgi:hypothetical protein
MRSQSVTRATRLGAYVVRRVRQDGTVKVAGAFWKPRGEGAPPGTWLGFYLDDDRPALLDLSYPGLDLDPPPARLWERVTAAFPEDG